MRIHFKTVLDSLLKFSQVGLFGRDPKKRHRQMLDKASNINSILFFLTVHTHSYTQNTDNCKENSGSHDEIA